MSRNSCVKIICVWDTVYFFKEKRKHRYCVCCVTNAGETSGREKEKLYFAFVDSENGFIGFRGSDEVGVGYSGVRTIARRLLETAEALR